MLLECLLQHLYTSEQQCYEKAFIPLQALDSIHLLMQKRQFV